MMDRPWWYESAGPSLWNEWTWTHITWGMIAREWTDSFLLALAVHTLYEMGEGRIFPREHRDVSARNHLGDTVAFMAGWYIRRK